jgi:hypothetical protein
MTGQERDYEAILSRVLHTTTDELEPVGDGLTKIRARLSEPWLKRQWWLLCSELLVLRWFVVVRCESLFSKIRSRSDVTDLTPDAAADPADGGALKSLLSMATSVSGKDKKQHRSLGPAMAWLRPALAVAGAVVLVVAGVFALGQIREGLFFGLANGTGTNSSTSGQQNPNGSANGSGSEFPGSGTSSQGSSGAASSGASAGNSKAAPSATPCAAGSPSAQNSPPPTSPPPTSPPPTSPPPTSPPPTSPPPTSPPPTSPPPTQGPLIGGIPGPTQEPIGTTALVACGQAPAAPSSPSSQPPSGA